MAHAGRSENWLLTSVRHRTFYVRYAWLHRTASNVEWRQHARVQSSVPIPHWVRRQSSYTNLPRGRRWHAAWASLSSWAVRRCHSAAPRWWRGKRRCRFPSHRWVFDRNTNAPPKKHTISKNVRVVDTNQKCCFTEPKKHAPRMFTSIKYLWVLNVQIFFVAKIMIF